MNIPIYIFALIAFLTPSYTIEVSAPIIQIQARLNAKQGALEGDRESIKDYIHYTALDYGVDPVLAVTLADIESDFIPTAKNPSSTATGIFQFIRGTWEGYCVGQVTNPVHNIDCAMNILREPNGIKHWTVSKPTKRALVKAGLL